MTSVGPLGCCPFRRWSSLHRRAARPASSPLFSSSIARSRSRLEADRATRRSTRRGHTGGWATRTGVRGCTSTHGTGAASRRRDMRELTMILARREQIEARLLTCTRTCDAICTMGKTVYKQENAQFMRKKILRTLKPSRSLHKHFQCEEISFKPNSSIFMIVPPR
jgi:hypothetical protein